VKLVGFRGNVPGVPPQIKKGAGSGERTIREKRKDK